MKLQLGKDNMEIQEKNAVLKMILTAGLQRLDQFRIGHFNQGPLFNW